MENEFRLPDENSNEEFDQRRIVELIEDIRADIDFELDDVVTSIVRDLPSQYFRRTKREDQVTHLKGLLASRICQFAGELFLNSSDGTRVAVLGRSSYKGQLARILSDLPGQQTRLIGANIYTSESHDFILDVFEFATDGNVTFTENPDPVLADQIAREAKAEETSVIDFLSRIRPSTSENSDLQKLTRLFQAHDAVNHQPSPFVDIKPDSDSSSDVLIAVRSKNERSSFQKTAALISRYGLDIQQAELVIARKDKAEGLPVEARTDKSLLMSFKLSSPASELPTAEKWIADLGELVASFSVS